MVAASSPNWSIASVFTNEPEVAENVEPTDDQTVEAAKDEPNVYDKTRNTKMTGP